MITSFSGIDLNIDWVNLFIMKKIYNSI